MSRTTLISILAWVMAVGLAGGAEPPYRRTSPKEAETIELRNPSLENQGSGWMISKQGNWCSEGAHPQLLTDLYTHQFDEAVEKRFWFTFDVWYKRADGMGHGLINTSEETVQLCPAYHAYGKVTGKFSSAAREACEGDYQRTHFSFEKRGKLISRPVGMPEPGPYYTCLVKMDQVDRFPYEYALYFSTDHDRGKGGIWLYVGDGDPTDADSWKSYDQAVADGEFDYLQEKPAGNPIFFDSVQGRQTETPHANVIDGTVYIDLPQRGRRAQPIDLAGHIPRRRELHSNQWQERLRDP